MLRDPSLIPLSHQHQHGLALCVAVRRSLAGDRSPKNLARLAREVAAAYEAELANHFAIEEQVLFPLCLSLPMVAELIADHRALESMVAQLRTTAAADLLENNSAVFSPATSAAKRTNCSKRFSARCHAKNWTASAPRSAGGYDSASHASRAMAIPVSLPIFADIAAFSEWRVMREKLSRRRLRRRLVSEADFARGIASHSHSELRIRRAS
jgi:hypothetical protein